MGAGQLTAQNQSQNVQVMIQDMQMMAGAIARSGLFGMKTQDQALALMIVAQAEGRHPGSVATEYHIIQGQPSLKADAMLARFQDAGGIVEWEKNEKEICVGTFSHPSAPKKVKITWTLADAEDAELFKTEKGKRLEYTKNGWKTGKWSKYPRAMLKARVISEGVRTVYPGVSKGIYTPEEVSDFAPESHPQQPVSKPEAHPCDEVHFDIRLEIQKIVGDLKTLKKAGWTKIKKKVMADSRFLDENKHMKTDAANILMELRRLWEKHQPKSEEKKDAPPAESQESDVSGIIELLRQQTQEYTKLEQWDAMEASLEANGENQTVVQEFEKLKREWKLAWPEGGTNE